MNIFWTILIIIAAYFFIVFVLLRLAVPFMGFGNFSMPGATITAQTSGVPPYAYVDGIFNGTIARGRKQQEDN